MHDKFQDEEHDRGGYVAFMIAPGLLKRGTEMGAKLSTENTLLIKAFVKLEPEEANEED
jgi:hypothetical protein